MDAETLQTWLRLTTDAVKGAEEARQALRFLGENALFPETVSRWMSLWMPQSHAGDPGRDGAVAAREFQGLIEEWWKNIGAVPRYRYLELLERHYELTRRLEQADETIERLKKLLAAKGAEAEAEGALGAWQEITRKALELQADWARTWTEGRTAKKQQEEE